VLPPTAAESLARSTPTRPSVTNRAWRADTCDMDNTDSHSIWRQRRGCPPAARDALSALLRRDTRGWRTAGPALLALLVVIATGSVAGALAFKVVGGSQGWPITVERTAVGWRLSSPGLQQRGVALANNHMVWNNGGCLQLFDLHSGKTIVLALPASGDGASQALVSNRYVVWTENKNPTDSGGFKINIYDLLRRHWSVVPATSGCDGTIALSGSLLYWEGDSPQDTNGNHTVIHGVDLASGRAFAVASGAVELVDASGNLVMWTRYVSKKAGEVTVVKDLTSGRLWRLQLRPRGFILDGCRLTGRALVWQLDRPNTQLHSRIEELNLDSGVRRCVAQGRVWGLSVAEGRLVWSGRSGVPLMEDTNGGPVVALPVGRDWDDLPVISGSQVAWEYDDIVQTARLNR
jgi:hypothetical protein